MQQDGSRFVQTVSLVAVAPAGWGARSVLSS